MDMVVVDSVASGLPEELAALVAAARRVVVLSGAGISAESGVPTFRDARTGLWAHYDPQDLATPEAFERQPALVWDWYQWRRELIARVEPNAAHLALKRWQDVARVVVVTQNVDGLHGRAGSRDVIELHGNILRTVCARRRHVVGQWESGQKPPRCPHCGSPLRPDVVWFGEMLPVDALQRASREVTEAELVLSVGTSTLVQPAASLPLEALRAGVPVVEINPDATPLTERATFSLRGPAGEILPALVHCAESHGQGGEGSDETRG